MELSNQLIVRRFRWIMIGTMLLDIIVTLASQPSAYWLHRTAAFESNSLFRFFLIQTTTWGFFLALLYMLASFVIVSVLPAKTALVGVFSFIICHFFRVSCWLDYHWQFGMTATIIYALLIGELVLFFGLTKIGHEPVKIVKRIRWLMIGAMIFDMLNTILGQPASYWHNPETANEGFPLSHFFIVQGLPIYLLYNLVLFPLYFILVSSLSARMALVLVTGLILSYYFGASTWINNSWHVSAEGPIIYGIILALVFVLLVFPGAEKKLISHPPIEV